MYFSNSPLYVFLIGESVISHKTFVYLRSTTHTIDLCDIHPSDIVVNFAFVMRCYHLQIISNLLHLCFSRISEN